MAYSDRARALRMCRHVYPDGRSCKAWAVWDDPRQLCVAHAGRCSGKPSPGPWAGVSRHARPVLCTCPAYAWPHRPGGGLCRWPDPPLYRCTIPAGTHSLGYLRPPRFLTRMGIHTVRQGRRLGWC